MKGISQKYAAAGDEPQCETAEENLICHPASKKKKKKYGLFITLINYNYAIWAINS